MKKSLLFAIGYLLLVISIPVGSWKIWHWRYDRHFQQARNNLIQTATKLGYKPSQEIDFQHHWANGYSDIITLYYYTNVSLEEFGKKVDEIPLEHIWTHTISGKEFYCSDNGVAQIKVFLRDKYSKEKLNTNTMYCLPDDQLPHMNT